MNKFDSLRLFWLVAVSITIGSSTFAGDTPRSISPGPEEKYCSAETSFGFYNLTGITDPRKACDQQANYRCVRACNDTEEPGGDAFGADVIDGNFTVEQASEECNRLCKARTMWCPNADQIGVNKCSGTCELSLTEASAANVCREGTPPATPSIRSPSDIRKIDF